MILGFPIFRKMNFDYKSYMILPTLTKNYIEQIVNFIEEENLAEPQNLNDVMEEERFAGGRSCPHCDSRGITTGIRMTLFLFEQAAPEPERTAPIRKGRGKPSAQ